jgi:hypothetical protein
MKITDPRPKDENNDLALRFMGIVSLAKQNGINVMIVAAPDDAMDRSLREFRIVGDHAADLECQLDIVEGYITGLRWRGVTKPEPKSTFPIYKTRTQHDSNIEIPKRKPNEYGCTVPGCNYPHYQD